MADSSGEEDHGRAPNPKRRRLNDPDSEVTFAWWDWQFRNNRKGGTASLRSRTCVKRNAVFGARFKGLSLYFLYQKGNLVRIKTG